ncbi:MAG: DUF4251 domain-containing protein [Prolixibacteraceae bacterium]|jgi:hypothetical protein
MKRLIVLLGFVLSANMLFAQRVDENSLTKKEKRNAETEKQYQITKSMLENRDFVLQTDFLQDRYGNRFFVSSNINFVAVDSAEAVIQIGSNYRLGPNGVGGVTAKGQITKWKLTSNNKNKTFGLSINVMTPIGIYDLYFSIGASGGGTATLTGLSSGRLTFDGNLVPWEDSSVYVGQHL